MQDVRCDTRSLKRRCKVRRIAPSVPARHLPRSRAGLLSSLKMVVRRDQAISPPGQEGIKGWSIETAKKHSNTAIYRKVGDQPPLSPPVQEGNLNCQAEENLTALPILGG